MKKQHPEEKQLYTFNCDRQHLDRLREVSRESGVPISILIRRAIGRLLATIEGEQTAAGRPHGGEVR